MAFPAAIAPKSNFILTGVSVVIIRGIGYNGEAIPASSTIEIEVNVTAATPYSFTATDATTGLTYSTVVPFKLQELSLVTLINNGTSIAWDKYGVTINMTLQEPAIPFSLSPTYDILNPSLQHIQTGRIINVTYGTQTWMDRNLGCKTSSQSY